MPRTEKQTITAKFRAWLKNQGKSTDTQVFDNNPKGLAKAFFTKGDAHVTAQTLQNVLWWWKHATSDEDWQSIFVAKEPANAFRVFIEYQQLGAYFYEFRARYDQRYTFDFGRPWILCSREQREFLESLWRMNTTPTVWRPSREGEQGWATIPARLINLKANDAVLRDQFLDEVGRLRQKHHIKRPGPGQGVRRKPVSFLAIELLDRKYYLGAKLNDSQRSQVSKFERRYLDACKAVGVTP